ncbi:MAG: undecaprenyl-diphosphate phosphatase [Candidatus Omnitrophota bacterium]
MKFLSLGIIQGITEFLPISSSGHLYILKRLLGLQGDYFSFFIFLHIATLAAIVIFLSKNLKWLFDKRLLTRIAVITVITAIMGLSIKFYLGSLFGNKNLLTFCFIINAGILLSIRPGSGNKTYKDMTYKDAFIIGIMQGFSPFPGISRSGVTIAGFLRRGFSRKQAFVLSFLLAIPVMIGAFILEFKELITNSFVFKDMAIGFISAFLSGLIALGVVKKTLLNQRFKNFAYYCLILAILNWAL